MLGMNVILRIQIYYIHLSLIWHLHLDIYTHTHTQADTIDAKQSSNLLDDSLANPLVLAKVDQIPTSPDTNDRNIEEQTTSHDLPPPSSPTPKIKTPSQ